MDVAIPGTAQGMPFQWQVGEARKSWTGDSTEIFLECESRGLEIGLLFQAFEDHGPDKVDVVLMCIPAFRTCHSAIAASARSSRVAIEKGIVLLVSICIATTDDPLSHIQKPVTLACSRHYSMLSLTWYFCFDVCQCRA